MLTLHRGNRREHQGERDSRFLWNEVRTERGWRQDVGTGGARPNYRPKCRGNFWGRPREMREKKRFQETVQRHHVLGITFFLFLERTAKMVFMNENLPRRVRYGLTY